MTKTSMAKTSMAKRLEKLEKHVESSIKLRRLMTNADHHLVPEWCELPPEIEALQHYAERVDLDDAVERLSITTF